MKYDVSVVYQAEFYTQVEAENEEAADRIARRELFTSSIHDIDRIVDTYVEEA